MKKKMPYVLAGILLMISLVCMACGSTQEATALPDDANESIQDEEDEDALHLLRPLPAGCGVAGLAGRAFLCTRRAARHGKGAGRCTRHLRLSKVI